MSAPAGTPEPDPTDRFPEAAVWFLLVLVGVMNAALYWHLRG